MEPSLLTKNGHWYKFKLFISFYSLFFFITTTNTKSNDRKMMNPLFGCRSCTNNSSHLLNATAFSFHNFLTRYELWDSSLLVSRYEAKDLEFPNSLTCIKRNDTVMIWCSTSIWSFNPLIADTTWFIPWYGSHSNLLLFPIHQ